LLIGSEYYHTVNIARLYEIILQDIKGKESPRWEGYGRLKALPTKNLFHWYEKRDRP